jgi:subtilisin-like proprotein convertase family protein
MKKRTNEVRLLAMMLLAAGAVANANPVYEYVGCTSCVARIPDATGAGDGAVTARIVVPPTLCTGSTVSAYALQIGIAHSNISDLTIDLKNPGGSTASIINRPFSSATCHGDDIAATFTDTGATATCGTLIPAIGGHVKAADSLATLGSLASGTWSVEIHDQVSGDDGFLNTAQFRVTCGYSDGIFTDSFELP